MYVFFLKIHDGAVAAIHLLEILLRKASVAELFAATENKSDFLKQWTVEKFDGIFYLHVYSNRLCVLGESGIS